MHLSNDKGPVKCKKKPLSKKDAQTILNYIKHKDRHHKRRKETRIYQCPECNYYHLTKMK